MRFLFLVQGEGRGHLTQAIALSQLLRAEGHEIKVLVGNAKNKVLPAFFEQQIGVPIEEITSPHFVFEADGSLSFIKNILHHSRFLDSYFKSASRINQVQKSYEPDVIVNFYEVLCGLYSVVYRPKAPIVCIGHHYMMSHSSFVFPRGQWLDRQLLRFSNWFTSIRAAKRLVLSFSHIQSEPHRRLIVVPPLIRQEVLQLTPTKESFWLVYLNYAHLATAIINWHKANPNVRLHCFCSHNYPTPVYDYDDTLTFHALDGTKYLEMMARCEALVTTAGFESVCEALYLGKPTMTIPVHYEQRCNALDAERVGAGVSADGFDLSILNDYLPKHNNQANERFGDWYLTNNNLIVRELEHGICKLLLGSAERRQLNPINTFH